MKTARLIDNYSIDSHEYEIALRQRRNAIRRKREMKRHIYTKKLDTNVYSSIIHNRSKL